MKAFFGSNNLSDYYVKTNSDVIHYFNFLEIDLDTFSIVQRKTLSEGLTPQIYSIAQALNSTHDVDVHSLVNDYLIDDYLFYLHSNMFYSYFSVEPKTFNNLVIPFFDSNENDFLDHSPFKIDCFKLASISVPIERIIVGSPSTFTNISAFVSFHVDPTSDNYYIVVYFPVSLEYSSLTSSVGSYPPISSVKYAYSKYNIKKKLTNCCLKQCCEPTKYIFKRDL